MRAVFFTCTPEEGSKALPHRFAAAGAAIRYQAVHADEVEDIGAGYRLRRSDARLVRHLPPEIDSQLVHKLYGHFMCRFHQDYIVKKGVVHALKAQMLEALLRARGAQYPAERNVGHLYAKAPEAAARFYRQMTQPTV